ncbi:hypothetical protein [Phormidium sp. CCY1219]|uniref:hypothetical protein n=1 Tax=Phormidium sp. CCY1219 TaxID=2886104 RepID=UPI002D1EA3F6|nr:hypothetical protein [Phormidium sp. CCY1219]MEB3828384.1 hypothetical protein [Phormidium sp. CCY1219]
MTVQDDIRETFLIELFQLERPENPTRSGTDAILSLNGQKVEFELKSSTKSSVTTVRDFGIEHIRKWQGKHWLFGFYSSGGKLLNYCFYGSPKSMAPWIAQKEAYILYDCKLAQLAPERLTLSVLYEIVGKKEFYTLEDAKKLHKRQYRIQEYRAKMDRDSGYSPERMLSILQDRCRYLIERGARLNNPHIPASYFEGRERITNNHAQRLRELVYEALQDNT